MYSCKITEISGILGILQKLAGAICSYSSLCIIKINIEIPLKY